MKVFCDTEGSYTERLQAAADDAGVNKRLKVQWNAISTELVFEYMGANKMDKTFYVVVCGSHIKTAAHQSGSVWYLLDNMNGLFYSPSLKDMLLNSQGEQIGYDSKMMGWQNYAWTKWLILHTCEGE